MSVKCNIDIDLSANNIVFSGRDVTGTVTLTIDKPTAVKGVTVEIEGKGKCKWAERSSSNVTIVHTGMQIYLSDMRHLIKPEEGEKSTLKAGVHTFPFVFHIPENVPSSWELPGASIRYRIRTQVLRPWRLKLEFDARFTVFSHVDLNLEASASDPVIAEQTKKFYHLMGKGSDMKVEVRSPVGGYVPGQVVPLSCKFSNESSVNVRHVEAALFKKVKYTTHGGECKKWPPQRKEKVRCNKLVPEQDGTVTADLELTIPSDLSIGLYNSQVVSVTYAIKVKIKVSGLHKSPVVSFPVVIGSLPLHDLPGPSTNYVPHVSEPPPSYEESKTCRNSSSLKEERSEKMKTMPDDGIHKVPNQ